MLLSYTIQHLAVFKVMQAGEPWPQVPGSLDTYTVNRMIKKSCGSSLLQFVACQEEADILPV